MLDILCPQFVQLFGLRWSSHGSCVKLILSNQIQCVSSWDRWCIIYTCSRDQECSFIVALVFSVDLHMLCPKVIVNIKPDSLQWRCWSWAMRLAAKLLWCFVPWHILSDGGQPSSAPRILAQLRHQLWSVGVQCIKPCKIHKKQKLKVPLRRMDNYRINHGMGPWRIAAANRKSPAGCLLRQPFSSCVPTAIRWRWGQWSGFSHSLSVYPIWSICNYHINW